MLTNPRDTFSSQSRSINIVPFHMIGIVSSCAIVTLSLRGAVFTIFDFKKCRDLEIGVRGHSRSLKVTPFKRLCMVSYYSNTMLLRWWKPITFSLKRTVFEIFDFKTAVTLKTGLGVRSRSLQMSPCDRAYMTSYWRSIVTMALSRAVSEIFNVEKCRDLEIRVKCHSRSLRVVLFDRLCMVSY